MKTRWGTCDNGQKNIWFNLELAKKPLSNIEYVVVHELLHLIEGKHSKKFVKLLTQYLPKWRSEKDELNRFILAHEKWLKERKGRVLTNEDIEHYQKIIVVLVETEKIINEIDSVIRIGEVSTSSN